MAHENLSRDQHVETSSDRSFGLVFAGMFCLIGGLPLLHGGAVRWWAVGLAAIFAFIALVRPATLSGLNRLWSTLGILMGKVISPIALGILFYAVITPLGVVMRFRRKDSLRLKFEPEANSYWIPRDPPGPSPDSMTQQF